MTTPLKTLLSTQQSLESELEVVKASIREHQYFILISSCYGCKTHSSYRDDGLFHYDEAIIAQQSINDAAHKLKAEGADKWERECVTLMPYKWRNTYELIDPDNWEPITESDTIPQCKDWVFEC